MSFSGHHSFCGSILKFYFNAFSRSEGRVTFNPVGIQGCMVGKCVLFAEAGLLQPPNFSASVSSFHSMRSSHAYQIGQEKAFSVLPFKTMFVRLKYFLLMSYY